MTTMAAQITSLAVVYSTVYSDANQRKHQSSASLAFVWGIHRDRWIPRTKGQLRGKCMKGAAFEVRAWISHFIPHFVMDVIIIHSSNDRERCLICNLTCNEHTTANNQSARVVMTSSPRRGQRGISMFHRNIIAHEKHTKKQQLSGHQLCHWWHWRLSIWHDNQGGISDNRVHDDALFSAQ